MGGAESASRGPTARGRRRRESLLQAAVDLLATDGVSAVSHRAVASRAGLPLAATTYYFASREDLVEHALMRLRDQHVAAARAVSDVLPAGDVSDQQFADAVVDVVLGDLADQRNGVDPGRLAALYERYLQAGRHPALRDVVRTWNAALVEILDDLLRRAGLARDGERARLLLAVVDGLLVAALGEGDAAVVGRTRADLARFLASTGWRTT